MSHFLMFNLTFSGSILSLRYIYIFETSIKFLNFLIPNMTYLKEQKNYLSEGLFFTFLDTKPQIRNKLVKIKKNTFSKLVL
jgi:hypothetical protein